MQVWHRPFFFGGMRLKRQYHSPVEDAKQTRWWPETCIIIHNYLKKMQKISFSIDWLEFY